MSYEPPKKKKPKGGFKREKGVGEWIREYLTESGPDYVQSMWREYKFWCRGKGYKPPTYESFRSYFNKMFTIGLVEFVGEEESDWGADKRYYTIAPSRANDDDAWKRPYKEYGERNEDEE